MPDKWFDDDLQDDERLSALEHLTEVEIESFENQTELKYIRGECNVTVKYCFYFLRLIQLDILLMFSFSTI